MYCTNLAVYGSKAYPLALGSLYGGIANVYGLPAIEVLLQSLKRDVVWPVTDRLQVHYLDSLLEDSAKDLFQVRFAPRSDVRDLISIFLSIQNSQIMNMTITFPGKTGRGAFSTILGLLKSTAHALHMQARDFEFQAEGFPEQGPATYIREHSLSAFVWVDGLNRYIHVKEDPRQFPDVRRGKSSL